MKFIFESEGGRLHWIVKVVEKNRIVEVHRFYRALDGFIYHRGDAGKHVIPAREALVEHLNRHPELTENLEKLNPGEHSTMHVRQIAAGGAKRG